MDESEDNSTYSNDSCDKCLNELCFSNDEYAEYLSYISVDNFEVALVTLNVIVFLAGIIGNLLVIIAVTTTKSMQSVTNIFIVNLAMADMLVMLFCAPPSVIWDVTNTWIFGSLMCKIVIYIQDISVSVSVLTLTFIAYDRYNAICRPLQFSTRKTKAAAVIGAIWTISSMIGIPDAVTLHLVPFFDKQHHPCMSDDIIFDFTNCTFAWNVNVEIAFIIVKAIVLYTLPLIFMSIAYYFIVKTLWRRSNLPTSQDATDTTSAATAAGGSSGNHQDHANTSRSNISNGHSSLLNRSCTTTARAMRFVGRSQSGAAGNSDDQQPRVMVTSMNSASRNLEGQLKTRRKVAKMLIAVVIMFSINFFPVHFLPILRHIVEKNTVDQETRDTWMSFFQKAAIITHCMCYFNSAINPIIYYFMSAQFKAQYRRILSCRCTADSPQIDYGRYLAGRGQQGVLAANVQQSQRFTSNNRRAADNKTVRKTNECISLRELRPGAQKEHHQVVIERPIIEESEPFIQQQNEATTHRENGSNNK